MKEKEFYTHPSLWLGWSAWPEEQRKKMADLLDAVPGPLQLHLPSKRPCLPFQPTQKIGKKAEQEALCAAWMTHPEKHGFALGLWLRNFKKTSETVSPETGWWLLQMLPLFPEYAWTIRWILGEKFTWFHAAIQPMVGWEVWDPGQCMSMPYYIYQKGWEKALHARPNYVIEWLMSNPHVAPILLYYTQIGDETTPERIFLLHQLLEKADGPLWLTAMQASHALSKKTNASHLAMPQWAKSWGEKMWEDCLAGQLTSFLQHIELRSSDRRRNLKVLEMYVLTYALLHVDAATDLPDHGWPDFQFGHKALQLPHALQTAWAKARPISFFKYHRSMDAAVFSTSIDDENGLKLFPLKPQKAFLEGWVWHHTRPWTAETFDYLWKKGQIWPDATRRHWQNLLQTKTLIDQYFSHA